MSKYIEYEVRFLDLDEGSLIAKLESIGAERVGEYSKRTRRGKLIAPKK